MPTYLYETVPGSPDESVDRFEVRQSFSEPPRRVISGGIGLMTKSENSLPEAGPGCEPANCGCGRYS